MNFGFVSQEFGLAPKFRQLFRPRELFVHDGTAMRRIHISTRLQVQAASAGALALMVSVFGIGQAALSAAAVPGLMTHRAEIAQMENRVEALQAEVAAIRTTAHQHVAKLEARQTFLAAVMTGGDAPEQLAGLVQSDVKASDPKIAAMYSGVERQQAAMAGNVLAVTNARYKETLALVNKLGLSSVRLSRGGGMGGPYEPVAAAVGVSQPAKATQADPQFRALFNSWNRLDRLQTAIVAIPSAHPVDAVSVNSGFGVRSDPFRGGRAMHAGVDMPGPYGTKIYATADGRVGRTGWHGGYGNLVELEHGKGIQTRYGHLSSILVAPGAQVKRGQLIALMGSTGRSTGNHLHYEVRLDGRAVNPMPFLQTKDYLLAMQQRPNRVAVGGPVEKAGK